MAYKILNTDGTTLLLLADNTVNESATDLSLVGKNVNAYGQYINNNFVRLLANSASSINSPPRSPLKGQIWYDTTAKRLKVYDGTFTLVTGALVTSTTPTSPTTGDFWWNSTDYQLNVWNGSVWTIAGPAFPRYVGDNGWILPMGNVQDRFSTNKQVTLLKNYGTTLGIMSSATFTTTFFTSATTLLPTNTTPVFRGLNIFGSLHATDSVTATNTVTTTHLQASTVRVTGANTTTNTLTGAVVVTGGVGIGGSIYIGGSNNIVSSPAGDKWIFSSTLTTATSRLTVFDNGIYIGTNARWSSPNWIAEDSYRPHFLYSQNEISGRHEFRTSAPSPGNITWITGLTVGDTLVRSNLTLLVTTVTNATSTNTGALQVTGGVGIGGNLWVGGDIVANKLTIQYTTVTTVSVQTDDVYTTFNSTPSTSTSTGAMVVAGGIGVNLGIFVGGTVTATSVVVTNLTATNLLAVSFTATDITATSLTSTNATFVSFTATTASIVSFTATIATITNFIATTASIESFTSTNAIITNLTVVGPFNTFVTTVNALPSASVAGVGARAFVTNATTTTFNDAVVDAGGSGYSIPVFSNGSSWYIG